MSEYRNLSDVVAQLQSAGLVLDSVKGGSGGTLVGMVYVESTRSVRCDTMDRPGKKSGAYRLHELRLNDGIWLAGSYWIDHGSTSYKLELNKECAACGATMPLKSTSCPACGSTKRPKPKQIPQELIDAHRKRMEDNRRQALAEEKASQARAAQWATAVWRASREATPDDHDYFARKGLSQAGGVRVYPGNDGVMLEGCADDDYRYLGQFAGALVVPACDTDGKVHGVQFILHREKHRPLIQKIETDKVFWPRGAGMVGKLFLLGGSPSGLLLVAEGYATAMSLHLATGHPVAVAWNAGNLPAAVAALRKRYRRANLLVCADDDWLQRCVACQAYTPVETATCAHCGKPHGKGNAGQAKAREAALATDNTAMVTPVFTAPRPENRKGPTDFNDLHAIESLNTVRAQIEAKLLELGWGASLTPAPPLARGDSQQGGGESERRAAVSVLSLEDVVERFIYIDDDTGDFAFDTWTKQVVKLSKVIKILPARVRFDDVKDHPTWRSRAVYIDQIGFDPGGEDRNILCNRWNGWPTVPKAGSCERMLELLAYLTCNEPNSREILTWMLRWLAYPIQFPGAKLKSAIVIHGPQGTGKSMVFEAVARIYGEYSMVLNQGAIEDKFNADWSERKLFILADEIVARAEMHHLKNQLKNFITGDWVRVNPKNVAAHKERNHMNIVFSSNEHQPVVLENDDRRHLIIWTPPKMDAKFYEEVSAEIEQGGIAALHHHLLHLDLGDFKPWSIPPMTQAKRDLIAIGADSIERFVQDWQNGDIEGVPFCPCGGADLYRLYLRWCRENGEKFPRTSAQFMGSLAKREGWFKGHKDRLINLNTPGTVRQRMVIPSEKSLNAAVAHGGDHRKPEHKTQTQWLSECYFDFKNAVDLGQPQ